MSQCAAETVEVFAGDLLPPDLGRDRDTVVSGLVAAYRSVMGNGVADWKLWETLRKQALQEIQERYARIGLEAAPWYMDAFWSRVDLPLPSPDPLGHVALVRALLTPYNARVCQHITYRFRTGGNVHIEWTGGTGMGKSSCAISLADWINPIHAPDLVGHLALDVGELPGKLAGKQPGQTVVLDEYLQTAGEGSRTSAGMFTNLEDTLRASQVNLFALSPRRQDHGTMQATFEVIMWHPAKKYSLFLVWVQGQPMGVCALPWARPGLWEAYCPWKERNVRRSLGAAFKDNKATARQALAAFAISDFVDYLVNAANKPKKSDFTTAIELFVPQMMSGAQVDRLASFMYMLCFGYDRLEPKLQEWFGITPNDGLVAVAKKCYKE